MAVIEYTQIKSEGFRNYFADNSNKIDSFSFIWFLMYYIMMIATPESPVCYYPTPGNKNSNYIAICSFILFARSLNVVFILMKVQKFLYAF